MRRLLTLLGISLLGGIVVLAVLMVRLDDRATELRRVRAEREQDHALSGDLRERLAAAQDTVEQLERDQSRLHEDLRSFKGLALGQRRVQEDLLQYLGSKGFSVSDSLCRGSDFGSVRPAILRPSRGARVSSPVIVHLMVVEPLLCDATFFPTVDGIPYQSQGPAKHRRPESPRNPSRMKAMPGIESRFSCISGGSLYLEFELPPGSHTLRINGGCPQGTDVPRTIETEVDFVVR